MIGLNGKGGHRFWSAPKTGMVTSEGSMSILGLEYFEKLMMIYPHGEHQNGDAECMQYLKAAMEASPRSF